MLEDVQTIQSYGFQHCDLVDHMKYNCLDLHPFHHYGKRNHSSDRCVKLKKHARVKLAAEKFTSSYLVLNREEH